VGGRGIDGILVFGADGILVERYGGRGRGPGEFARIEAMLVGPDDTIHVIDPANARETVLLPPAAGTATPKPYFRVARTQTLMHTSGPSGVRLLADGSLAMATRVDAASAIHQPLHVFDSARRSYRSFGAGSDTPGATSATAVLRVIAVIAGRELWSMRQDSFLLERWSPDGNRLASRTRIADWMGWPEDSARKYPGAPRPFIVSMREDPQGRLWTLGLVPGAEWKEPGRVRVGGEVFIQEVQSADESFDTMIEVVDPRTGKLMASIKHPIRFNQFADSEYLVQSEEMPDGSRRISLWRFELK
jgi:hypothetical protein